MSKRKIIIIGAAVVVVVLLAAAIATAGGIVGYVVARRHQALGLPWRLYQFEQRLGPGPFFQPPPEMRGPFVILPFGAQVTWVEEGSPAAEAGIKVGDIITAVDDQEIDEDHPLRDLVQEHEPGETIALTLNRWGESKEIQVTLGETTDEEGKTIPYLGVHYWPIERRFFQPQRFDRGYLEQSKLAPPV
jgi:membrane-associated protease RseP (regulator of RpoE activity)